jgi:hypothetical protein
MNEPVAWGYISADGGIYDCISPEEHEKAEGSYTIPLYTHPAKTEDEPNWKEMYWEMHELNHKHWSELKAHPAKTLTDEEIMEVFTAYEQMQEYGYVGKKPFQVSLGWSLSERNDCLMLARAILRKAQEK